MPTTAYSWIDIARRFPTALRALRVEPRVSYCLHIPPGFDDDAEGYRLVVAVHGTARSAQAYRERFAAAADRNRWIVLCPLFPIAPLGDGNMDGYKYMAEGHLRYDDLVLAMVAEVEEIVGLHFPTFAMFGFSGGGQFTHRFLYLHPERLSVACIGAPGGVTVIDDSRDFWRGTRNLGELFGIDIDLDALRRVRIGVLVGDLDTDEFVYPPGYHAYSPDMAATGKNRLERAQYLVDSYSTLGVTAELIVVPGLAHEGLNAIEPAAAFLAGALDASRPMPA